MNLGRLSQLLQLAQFGARAWRAPLALALVLVAVQLLGASAREILSYDRAGILAGGEYARLVTAHFFHYDVTHLAWNLVGLALVAALGESLTGAVVEAAEATLEDVFLELVGRSAAEQEAA